MVEDPAGDDAVEFVVVEVEPLDVTDSRVHSSLPRQMHHPRRRVDRDHLGPQLASESLGHRPYAAADLEHALRRRFEHGLEDHVPGIDTLDELVVDRIALVEPLLARELPAHEDRVVQPRPLVTHGSTIGVPGIPRPGAAPPSHLFTVAPTSPNSPSSCTCPAAFRPST